MTSATPDSPWMPHLSACGVMVCGGATIGYNAGGRMTNFYVTPDPRSAAINIDAERLSQVGRSDGNIFTWVNGSFSESGGTGVYRANREAKQQVLTFDALPLPPADYWKNFRTSLYAIWPPVIHLGWKGDGNTTRYTVEYATLANKSDADPVAIYSRNDYIEVTKNTNTSSPDQISVTGSDGASTGKSSYTCTINKTGDTITITVVNDETSVTEISAVEYEGYKLQFGSGLFIDLPNGWITSGDTEFTVQAGPKREYSLVSSQSDDHYFRVKAERLNETAVYSAWKYKSLAMPPSPVSSITVTYLSASSVRVGFTMPSDTDIAGWRLYLSPDYRSGHYVPHYRPVATGTASPSASVTTDLTGLAGGNYTFMVRTYDNSGRDDMTINIKQFYLSSGAVTYGDLNEPIAFKTEPQGLGQFKMTASTRLNSAGSIVEDNIYIYWNSGSGDVDYSASGLWDIIPKSTAENTGRAAKYTKTYSNVPSGTYTFGIRTERNGQFDGNTDVVDSVTVNDTAITVPYDLEVTVTSNG